MQVKRTSVAVAFFGAATLSLLLVAAPGLGGLPGRATAAPAGDMRTTIRVQDNFFDPRSTGVAQDGLVVWRWKGSNRHNVVFTKVPLGASRKGAHVRTSGRWRRSFPVPGLYRYVCRFYAGMRGTITVKPPTSGEGKKG
jgi:plastocyanin